MVKKNIKKKKKKKNDSVTKLMDLEGRNQWCLEKLTMQDERQMVFDGSNLTCQNFSPSLVDCHG